jgi:hypothetical protein
MKAVAQAVIVITIAVQIATAALTVAQTATVEATTAVNAVKNKGGLPSQQYSWDGRPF